MKLELKEGKQKSIFGEINKRIWSNLGFLGAENFKSSFKAF